MLQKVGEKMFNFLLENICFIFYNVQHEARRQALPVQIQMADVILPNFLDVATIFKIAPQFLSHFVKADSHFFADGLWKKHFL